VCVCTIWLDKIKLNHSVIITLMKSSVEFILNIRGRRKERQKLDKWVRNSLTFISLSFLLRRFLLISSPFASRLNFSRYYVDCCVYLLMPYDKWIFIKFSHTTHARENYLAIHMNSECQIYLTKSRHNLPKSNLHIF
jgi:hypothetical protein